MNNFTWGWPKAKCSFCESPSATSFVVEAGNGAEVEVPLELCESHDKEHEKDERAFDEKYEVRIDELATERFHE